MEDKIIKEIPDSYGVKELVVSLNKEQQTLLEGMVKITLERAELEEGLNILNQQQSETYKKIKSNQTLVKTAIESAFKSMKLDINYSWGFDTKKNCFVGTLREKKIK